MAGGRARSGQVCRQACKRRGNFGDWPEISQTYALHVLWAAPRKREPRHISEVRVLSSHKTSQDKQSDCASTSMRQGTRTTSSSARCPAQVVDWNLARIYLMPWYTRGTGVPATRAWFRSGSARNRLYSGPGDTEADTPGTRISRALDSRDPGETERPGYSRTRI